MGRPCTGFLDLDLSSEGTTVLGNHETYALIGDVHGHLQLALCMVARWQREGAVPFDAVFLAGDVGTFTHADPLDGATLSHAKRNPCELEFATHWSTTPPAPWLAAIFEPPPHGLGLTCPIVMVHGNHEGFGHLRSLVPRRRPADPVPIDDLPTVDTGDRIRYLPSGWRIRTAGGHVVAGVGGMEAGQRRSRYDEMAYVDDAAVSTLCDLGGVDLLVTHQGPTAVQGDHGSPTLQRLLDAGVARVWCHGHSTPVGDVTVVDRSTVVPLGDIAFTRSGEPGPHGFAHVTYADAGPTVVKAAPPFWREYRQKFWRPAPDGRLVCPDLWPFVGRR
jgi:hypothetical protein